jgi:hypothetical protein
MGLEVKKAPSTNVYTWSFSFIRCTCGARILLLPDLKAMDRAIESHVAKHQKREKLTPGRSSELDLVRKLLAEQVIEKSSAIQLVI